MSGTTARTTADTVCIKSADNHTFLQCLLLGFRRVLEDSLHRLAGSILAFLWLDFLVASPSVLVQNGQRHRLS